MVWVWVGAAPGDDITLQSSVFAMLVLMSVINSPEEYEVLSEVNFEIVKQYTGATSKDGCYR